MAFSFKKHIRSASRRTFTSLIIAALMTLVFYVLTLKPVKTFVAARDWVETPCVIEKIDMPRSKGLSRSSQSINYDLELRYAYEFNGKSYQGDRYDVMDFSAVSRKAMTKIVNRLTPDRETVCYVDPKNPSKSIIDRSANKLMPLGLLALPFMLISYGGLLHFFRKRLGLVSKV